MRRLTLTRFRDERGAIAVMSALLLVALIGFTALAVDIGALWWDKKQLQNGADAAALALAQSCAKGACEPDEPTMAGEYAEGNKNDPNVQVTAISHTANSVTVTVKTTRSHWFARVLGIADSEVTATATASWGTIGSAAVLPLTVSLCQLADFTSGAQVTLYTKGPIVDCQAGNPPHVIPGGFGWLVPNDECVALTNLGMWAASDTGNDGVKPAACDEILRNLAGKDVLMPVFDQATGSGSGGQYHLIGYAALHIDSYCLTNKWSHLASGEKCTGSERWIKGTFVKLVDLGSVIAPGPDFGVTAVQLTA